MNNRFISVLDISVKGRGKEEGRKKEGKKEKKDKLLNSC